MGRPAQYTTVEDMQTDIDAYFDNDEKKTISGLAYYLGFESRQSFYDYEKVPEYSYTIKRCRLRIEMGYEENLHGSACTGSIFALKNMGWSDKSEVEQTGTTTHINVTVDSNETAIELRKLIDGPKVK